MTKLSFPFTEQKIRALKVGDEVQVSGVVFTGCSFHLQNDAKQALI